MEDKEIIIEPEVTKVNTPLILAVCGAALLIFAASTFSYKLGVKDTKRLLEEPAIHLSLVPNNGEAIQVIPLKLTSKGIGIRFNTAVTNLSGIGIDFSNK